MNARARVGAIKHTLSVRRRRNRLKVLRQRPAGAEIPECPRRANGVPPKKKRACIILLLPRRSVADGKRYTRRPVLPPRERRIRMTASARYARGRRAYQLSALGVRDRPVRRTYIILFRNIRVFFFFLSGVINSVGARVSCACERILHYTECTTLGRVCVEH